MNVPQVDSDLLDVVLLDFQSVYQRDPEEAFRLIQILLFDEQACRERVAFLNQLQARAGTEYPELQDRVEQAARGRQADFRQEIDLIAELGAVPALRSGRITAERLAALTWNPQALWQAHRRLMDFDEITAGDTPTAPATRDAQQPAKSVVDFTELAGGKRFDELRRCLRPCLPALLARLDMDQKLAEPLEDFIIDRAGNLRGLRFREALPEWIQAFAYQQGMRVLPRRLTVEDWEAIIRNASIREVLQSYDRPERSGQQVPDWVRDLCRLALQRHLTSPQELLNLELPRQYPRPGALAIFRRDLYQQARSRELELQEQFELN